ncbi:MAG: S9 family peptidase [Prevotella sp.]|nr:S9 family peptidase [Bacteroides sp.]MCM1365686.1 S9 family peptidase [Prevotella sp.]MCM1437140.1 S9 family peptidase [Prevotella sp.]
MKKYLSLMIAGLIAVGSVEAQELTVEDYCDVNVAAPSTIKEMRPLSDGISYACISDDGKKIEVFNYKTGKQTSTLFDIDAVKGDLKISDFEGYKLSQNEKKILLWNDVDKIYRYSFKAEYFVYDIMRGTLKRVSTQGKQRGATISHDGRMVAYMRDNNIFISNLDYDTDKAITTDGKINEVINGISDWGYEEEFGVINTMRWSGDDNILAFVRFDESDVPTYSFDDYKSYCDEEPLSDPYPEPFKYKYPLAGYNNSIVSVHAYDLNTRVIKTMDLPIGEKDYVPSLEFDGNGKNLMVMLLNRDQNDLKLYSVNPGSTVARQIYTEKSNAWLSPNSYQMVKYFDNHFVIASDKTGYRHLYKYDYNGNLLKQLTHGDFNITAYYGSDALENSYVQTTKLGAINRNVAKVSSNGTLTLLHDEAGTESASFSSKFDYYVRTYSSATVPPQFTLWSTKGQKISNLEMNEKYAKKYASAPNPEFVKVRNAAGEDMDGYIIKPSNFDSSKKYPLLMYQYNGPESQLVTNSWKMEGVFYIASQGYVVACVDGRGTGNRSREWADAVYKQLGKYETEDQIAGANYFASLPYVDSEKTACFGWSFGGYMTLMELTQPNTPFKCGVSMAPVTDWRWYDSIYTERYMLTPQQNEEGYECSSAMNRTKNLEGRLLIMSGTSDDNVHYYNTLKYTSKLNFEGKIFDMMSFTGFEHSLRMCNARTQLFRKVVDFLDSHLGQ